MLPWKEYNHNPNILIADAGDLRVILKHQNTCWQLSMAFRVYTQDGTKSMIRPAASITHFPKEYTTKEAQTLAYQYVKAFTDGIISAI